MWDTLETVFYIVIVLLFVSTFLPKPIRARVRESLIELWRVLPHLWRTVEPHAYRLVTGREAPEEEAFAARERNRAVRDDFPLPSAEYEPFEEERSVREPPFALALTEEEVQAVARMIVHNRSVEKSTQSSAIEAGFGYKRGGGPGYDRAKEIYQAIFTPPKIAKFPKLTPDKKRSLPKAVKAGDGRAS